jgi:phosphatidate cytidylyltransferase
MLELGSMKQRIISGAIMMPLALVLVFLGGVLFNLVVILAVIVMSFEWSDIISKKPEKVKKYRLIGLVYLSIPAMSLIYLRDSSEGIDVILYLFFLVWGTDIGAYFAGKNFKGPKLAEKISPNKTVSGALGGIMAALIIGVIAFFTTSSVSFLSFLFTSVFLSIISQAGDLFESYIKRKFSVKDSGTLIPGHGGVLDRVDGLLFAAPALCLVFFGQHDIVFA